MKINLAATAPKFVQSLVNSLKFETSSLLDALNALLEHSCPYKI